MATKWHYRACQATLCYRAKHQRNTPSGKSNNNDFDQASNMWSTLVLLRRRCLCQFSGLDCKYRLWTLRVTCSRSATERLPLHALSEGWSRYSAHRRGNELHRVSTQCELLSRRYGYTKVRTSSRTDCFLWLSSLIPYNSPSKIPPTPPHSKCRLQIL